MNKTRLTVSMALMVLLLVSGVYAYQNSNKNNVNTAVDKTLAEEAVESGNYAAWKALHANSNGRMASLINESNFHLLQDLHEAKEARDYEKVKQIRAELGFSLGYWKGNEAGMHKGAGQSKNAGNCPYAN